jgi:uncharacterized protein with PQ loop repeat
VNPLLSLLPVAAALFAVPQFMPQLTQVLRTSDVAGVSWSWAALTSISNAGWIAYFALSHFWTALVPAASATLLAGVLAVILGRRGAGSRRAAMLSGGWLLCLVLAWTSAGRVGLGTVLAVSFILQVTPSVWTAYRTPHPTGISSGTWRLILAELLCWGIYGTAESDPRLTILGVTGVIASALMLLRARRARTPARRVRSSSDTLEINGTVAVTGASAMRPRWSRLRGQTRSTAHDDCRT